MKTKASTVGYVKKINAETLRALNQFYLALSEHRWDDANTLLPVIISIAQNNTPPITIWKGMLLLMERKFPLVSDQLEITKTFNASPLNGHAVVLDLLFQSIDTLDHKCFKELLEIFKETDGRTVTPSYVTAILTAYHGLYQYVSWIKKSEDCKECIRCSNSEYPEDCTSKIHFDDAHLGFKVYHLFTAALHLLHFYPSEESDTTNDQIPHRIEYIMGPLFDTEKRLRKWGMHHPQFMTFFDFKESQSYLTGIALVRHYLEVSKESAPAVRLILKHLLESYPEDEELINKAMYQVIQLSPSDVLILEYIERMLDKDYEIQFFVKNASENSSSTEYEPPSLKRSLDQSDDIFSERPKKKIKSELNGSSDLNFTLNGSRSNIESVPDFTVLLSQNDTCLLGVHDGSKLVKHLKLLTRLLEHSEWSRSKRPWLLLERILFLLHKSWVKCWNCDGCQKTRKKFRKFVCDNLGIWPRLFWQFPRQITEDEAVIEVAIAYSAFMFGGDIALMGRWRKLFKKNDLRNYERKLQSYVRYDGPFESQFLDNRTKINLKLFSSGVHTIHACENIPQLENSNDEEFTNIKIEKGAEGPGDGDGTKKKRGRPCKAETIAEEAKKEKKKKEIEAKKVLADKTKAEKKEKVKIDKIKVKKISW